MLVCSKHRCIFTSTEYLVFPSVFDTVSGWHKGVQCLKHP